MAVFTVLKDFSVIIHRNHLSHSLFPNSKLGKCFKKLCVISAAGQKNTSRPRKVSSVWVCWIQFHSNVPIQRKPQQTSPVLQLDMADDSHSIQKHRLYTVRCANNNYNTARNVLPNTSTVKEHILCSAGAHAVSIF